jgi:uncharacterized protein (DUF2141 family)
VNRASAFAAFGAIVLVAAIASGDDDPPAAPITVRVSRLRSNQGKVGCTLYDGPRGFPVDAKAAKQQRWCAIEGGVSVCRFAPVPRGTYAVACFHDENDNGRCDLDWLGIPSEGTVVSNHAKGTFGPPKFEDAKFAFSGEATELALRMGY